MGIFYGNKLFRIFIFFTESGKIKLQQNKDVIIGDEEDSEDVTTKDQDYFSDKTSRMLRSNVCVSAPSQLRTRQYVAE